MDLSIPQNILDQFDPNKKKAKKTYVADDTVFKPSVNAENGYRYEALVRILYQPGTPEVFREVHRHFYENMRTDVPGGKKWVTAYTCPKTIKEKCPDCEQYWHWKNLAKKHPNDPTVLSTLKKIEKHGANLSYLCRIFIRDDGNNPKNNGKVKFFYMSPGLYKKVEEAINPPKTESRYGGSPVVADSAVPFDQLNGVDLVIDVQLDAAGKVTYNNCFFQKGADGKFVRTPLASNESEMEAIFGQMIPFDNVVGKETILSYEQILEKMATHVEHTGVSIEGVEEPELKTASETSSGPGVTPPTNHVKSETKKDENYFPDAKPVTSKYSSAEVATATASLPKSAPDEADAPDVSDKGNFDDELPF